MGTEIGETTKIHRFGRCLVAFTGAPGAILAELSKQRHLGTWPRLEIARAMSQVNEPDTAALVLDRAGLWRICEDGHTWPAWNKIDTLGSGGDLARGYLTGFAAAGGTIGMDQVKAAVEFAATVDAGCGNGVQIEYLYTD
jgi:hypothetical protein